MLGAGLVQLIGADVLRPALPWLLAAVAPVQIAGEMGQVRDPEAIGLLRALRAACVVSDATFRPAVERIAVIMAAKGGCVLDITPGDCMELLERCAESRCASNQPDRVAERPVSAGGQGPRAFPDRAGSRLGAVRLASAGGSWRGRPL
jgi:hypothetical protein